MHTIMFKELKFITLSIFISTALAQSPARAALPHLDLEMTSDQYRALIDQIPISDRRAGDPTLRQIVEYGKRNLDWLSRLNQRRPAERKLAFSSAATQGGYPIDAPKESSPEIIQTNHQRILSGIPASMKAVIYEGGELTSELPLPEADYLRWGIEIDRVYQSASRWLLQVPNLSQYAAARSEDIRGFYYLNREENIQQKLESWRDQDATTQSRLRGWLNGLCMNSNLSSRFCDRGLTQAIESNSVWAFYQRYLPRAQSTWDEFFRVSNPRRDATWNEQNPNLFSLPFQTPETDEIRRFLADNIEDEWRHGDWQLRLDFAAGVSSSPRVEFVPGATPHVNGLGGSQIVMDANQPLTEYNVQWTIRHEFGHVLGFPDCYVEFYDSDRRVMVSYQIDITNLMCSRRGHLQDQHIEALRQAYWNH